MYYVLVAQSCLTLCNPMKCIACQALPYMEFSRQKYWSGLPFPSPGSLFNPRLESGSPALGSDSLLSEPPRKPWIFTGRTDAEAEATTLWPPDVKSQVIGKDPDAEKDWKQEKGVTEDEIVDTWYGWDGITKLVDLSLSKLQETVKDSLAAVHGVAQSDTT